MRDYWSDKRYFEQRIRELEMKIAVAKKNNENRQRLLAQREETMELSAGLQRYLDKLKVVLARATKENNDFRTRRLDLLDYNVSKDLGKVFQQEKFQAHITCDFKRKNVVKLVLTDASGNVFSPRMGNGMLVQYLTSFAAVSCITKTLGYKNLFIDEAFGCSSMNNLSVIGQILGDLVSEGMQIVCISQNPGLYQDLPRHEICLTMDTKNKKIIMVERDYGEECVT